MNPNVSEQAQFFLTNKTRTIVTNGEAEVRTQPDRVSFTLRAEKTEATLQPAVQYVEAIIAKIFEVARKFHIPPHRVQTDQLCIRPQIEYEHTSGSIISRGGTKRISKFYASKSVNVILEGELMAQYSNAMKEFLQTGCLVDGERYETSHLFEHRTRARQMAIQNAVAKATSLIEGLPVTLGAPIYIQESPSAMGGYHRPPQMQMQMQQMQMNVCSESDSSGGDLAEGSTFAAGTISVQAQVRVCFELVEGVLPPGGLVPRPVPAPAPAAGPATAAAAAGATMEPAPVAVAEPH